MRVYAQWHTQPQDPVIPESIEQNVPRNLITIIGSEKQTWPLYKQIEDASTQVTSQKEREWLLLLLASFDSYVVGMLRLVRLQEWPELNDDYRAYYGSKPTNNMTSKVVMARVLTAAEIIAVMQSISSLREADGFNFDFLWKPRVREPELRTDCRGNRDYWHQQSNIVQPQINGGQVGYLDPTNHWGIMVDEESSRR